VTPDPRPTQGKPVSQARLFQWLRRRLLHNQFILLYRGSPVRLISILGCCLVIWAGLFGFAAWGFHFLHSEQIPFAGRILGTMFDFLFVSLALMLFFSSGIILYSSLFASPEATFLLTTPARADQVFAYKFQGAITFSSWGFLLLGMPLLIAYGIIFGVPWYFYALLPVFFVGFILLPGSLGALACLLVVCCVPQKGRHVLIALGLVVFVVLAFIGVRLHETLERAIVNRDFVQQLYSQIDFARGPLVPSHWMTLGLQAAARGELPEVGYRLALLWSNGLFLYLVAAWLSGRLYRYGYDRMTAGGTLRRSYGGHWMDRILSAMVGFLDPQTRLLIIKDFRTFRRDPAQWAQIVILSSLLILYFVNTRRFWQEQLSRAYQNGLSLLNLVSVGLLMCAYTGRFIYPLLSLEGRKFWVLGLLPMRRDRLLWGKFAFSAIGTLVVAEFLMAISDLAIGMPHRLVGLHLLTIAVLALGLSGLSVGLGAWMPNFRETDPSKIAVGFGGTLNLVASLLFLLLVVGLMAVPWHVHAAISVDVALSDVEVDWLILAGVILGAVVGMATITVPLWIGGRTLRRMEF
jgi:ABC-2 type transport system permease protein